MASRPRSDARGGSSRQQGRRRTAVWWIARALFLAVLAAGVFTLLPALGGLRQDATELRHARPGFVVAAIIAQGLSLVSYAALYRRVLASLDAHVPMWLALRVTLATFLVSHVTPFGSATGTVLNVSTLQREGVPAATTGEAVGLTTLVSTSSLLALFGIGLAATLGRPVSTAYITVAAVALALVAVAAAAVLLVGSHPAIAERAGRAVGRMVRRVRHNVDPEAVARASKRLVVLARSALTGRAVLESFGFAAADLLFDLLSLDLMFLAFGYQPGFGPLAVAYAAANVAAVVPVTPGGLGVVEVTLVGITVGFGTPRATAVLAVLGYRVINYWLPLIPGAVAYIRLALSLKRTDDATPADPRTGVPTENAPVAAGTDHDPASGDATA